MTADNRVLRGHPGIELRVLTAYSGHLQQWLDDGDLDLSLLYNLASTPSLNVRPLVREKLWAVAPARRSSAVTAPSRPAYPRWVILRARPEHVNFSYIYGKSLRCKKNFRYNVLQLGQYLP